MKNLLNGLIVGLATLVVGVGCSGGDSTSYSLLAAGQGFKQASVSSKVDLLWVVDNSSSMQPLQQNLADNFNSFISQFVSKGYDFHLAVTGTDAYTADPTFRNDPTMAKFRDGNGVTHSGIFQIVPSTPNLLNVFVMNATLGASSSGDERAFSSFKAALNSPLNSGFLREGSFFGLIILSDEDDFSNPTRPELSFPGGDHNYAQAGLESVDSYVQYLDTLTNTTAALRRYSVSAITVKDAACQAAHAVASPSTIVGQRYIDLANKTSGVLGSVCDTSFASALEAIQQRIIELSTQFYLDSTPVPQSIVVSVNGVNVAQDTTNGWTYNSTANSVVFHGTAVPSAGATINVKFDPTSLKF